MTPLRVRNFRLLFAGRTISFFGTNFVPIALAFAVLDLAGSATDTGLVFAARTLAQISTLLVGGVVADRLPRQLVAFAYGTVVWETRRCGPGSAPTGSRGSRPTTGWAPWPSCRPATRSQVRSRWRSA